MWTASDDYGVVKGHPVWLRNQIYPFENINKDTFEKWIKELEDYGAIIPFTYHQEKYYFIKNFPKYQKIDHPSKQRNPEPPTNVLDCVATQSIHTLDETETETETETVQKKRKIEKIQEENADEVYEFYKSLIKPGPKRDTIINIKNLFKDGRTKDELMQYATNYSEHLKSNGKTDKTYWIQPNNFFGQKERYKEFLKQNNNEPEKPKFINEECPKCGSKETADYKQIDKLKYWGCRKCHHKWTIKAKLIKTL